MTARPFIDPARALIRAIVDAQPTPEKRLEFAEIAHQHGHIGDDTLARYEREVA
jgi:hypothetical protein